MSIETPKSSKQHIETPTADQIRRDVHPDLRPSKTADFIEEHANENPNSKRRRTMLVGGVIGGLVLGGGAAGLAALDHIAKSRIEAEDTNTDKSILPSIEATSPGVLESSLATPDNITPLETAPVKKSLEISASEYKTPEAFAKILFEDRITNWGSMGATAENQTRWREIARSDRQAGAAFIEDIARKNTPSITDALFVANYQNTPSLTEYIDRMELINTVTIERTFKSTNEASPYKRKIQVDQSTELQSGSIEDGSVTFSVHIADTNNSAMNNIGSLPGYIDDASAGTAIITAVVQNGNLKIADIRFK